jgi:hypothetical protein
MRTKFILEYRFEGDEEWITQTEYRDLSLIQEAYITHIGTYNHAFCRIRAVRVVEESRVLGEYQPINMEEY